MGRYTGKTCRLSTMLLLTSSFFLVEIIVGYVTNSIALIADSFHMLSDVVALIVGFASVRISKWPSKRNTYGWVRAEVLGALVNAVFLLALCFSILVEALRRLVEVEKVDNPKLLLFVGGAGLLVNVIGLFLFGGHGHSHGGGGHGHSHGGGGHGHSHGGGGHGHSHGASAGHHHGDLSEDHHHSHNMANGKGGHSHHGAYATESERLVGRPSLQSGGMDDSMDVMAGQTKKVFTDSSDDHEVYIAPGTNITVEMKKTQAASAKHLNMRGVFLHVLGDALGSVVVVVSALVIWFAEGDWKYYVDPAMSLVMVLIILVTTIPLLKESAFILLQTVPSHVNVQNIIKELEQMEGIYGVHECHIWQLAGNRIVASAHIRCHGIEEYMELAAKIKQLFHKAGIHSTTIQPEFIDWQDAAGIHQPCALMCESGGQLCMSNTCCGDKEVRQVKDTQCSSGGDSTTVNKNNSSAVDGDLAAGDSNPHHQHQQRLVNKGHHSSALFTSAHSLDVTFSADGDEVVLEMSDLPAIEDKEMDEAK